MADPDSKKVYVTGTDGKSIDAATGKPVASVPDSPAPFASTTACAAASTPRSAA